MPDRKGAAYSPNSSGGRETHVPYTCINLCTMNEEKATRKRFHKPYHFLNKGGEHPLPCLYEIFKSFHLDDFRRELSLWQELALCNDQSAYDEGGEREDLMDFVHGLQKLIEAFHLLHKKSNRQKINKGIKGFSKQTKKMLSQINTPVFLTTAEMDKPGIVIKHFCKTFSSSYATIELLDLLEAVITYEGNKNVYTGNLVLFYQHLQYLVRLAYKMEKHKHYVKQ